MNAKQSSWSHGSLTRALRAALKACGLLLCVAITLAFGLIPFLAGFLIQLLIRRRLPDAVLLPIGAATGYAVWHLFGWNPLAIGDPQQHWQSVVVSTLLAGGFSITGGHVSRFFRPIPKAPQHGRFNEDV